MIIRHTRSSNVLRRTPARAYARVVGGIINSPPPAAPTPQSAFKIVQVHDKEKQRSSRQSGQSSGRTVAEVIEAKNQSRYTEPFHLDISKPPSTESSNAFETVTEPPKLRPDHDLYEYLIEHTLTTEGIQSSPTLRDLLNDLNRQANAEIPQVLLNGNTGSPELSLNEISESIVTVAHVLPPAKGSADRGEVILSSGFAILDGSMIVTCTHPLHQINAHCRSYDALKQQANLSRARTLIVTQSGEILPVAGMASHLAMSDVVILQLHTAALRPLKVSPYPCPTGNPVLVYNLHAVDTASSMTSTEEGRTRRRSSWADSGITLYQDRAGREAQTGTYDALNTLLFDTVPTPGSSGGPIIDRETKAVVGIVRGSEVSYAVRKERGFGTPAETLFNVFKLDGF